MTAREQIEQAALASGGSGRIGMDEFGLPTERQVALSQAISLRRIADALDGTNGIGIAQAIENAIGTGMFHGFQNMKQ